MQRGGGNLGEVALTGAKWTVKFALKMLLDNRQLIEHVASSLYADETGRTDWARLQPPERAIWLQRVQSVILALSSRVNV